MLIRWLCTALATLGVGKIPKAPGTWGSLLALLTWWAIIPKHWGIQLVTLLVACFLGWMATHYYEKFHDKHDPKEVVIDELVGLWMVLLVMGLWISPGWIDGTFAFLLFRFFDIWKPFPVGWVDRKVPGAFGTLLDDGVAALWAIAVVYAMIRWGLMPFVGF
jgi:phosphatidylglycerophosphatase A